MPIPEGGDRHFQPAATAVRWLLTRVGGQGIRLTAAGYLPPGEDTTAPVFALRETAAQLRLLRRYRGQLLPTKKGAALRDDPEALRRYLAASLPTPPWWASGRYATDAGSAAPT
ncbi:hypothetical protein [Rhodococcus koreensis]|uniref:hypothetical protein n=1 Tax=Rhodococcus koreensis TaxID=99653 RepID=UPI00366AD0A4